MLVFLLYLYYNGSRSGAKWHEVDKQCLNGWPFVMLIGEYQHNIDAKGRIIVPSKLRESLGNEFVITKGIDNCLFIYPIERWNCLIEKLKSLPVTDSDVRRFARFFTSGAVLRSAAVREGYLFLPI